MPQTSETHTISAKRLQRIVHDTAKTAAAIQLVYVNDSEPGIQRIQQGSSFTYTLNGRRVKDKNVLLRIKHLVLPPAWTNVWICAKEHGHLQATGYDARNRKQYRYHNLWNYFRNQTKFFHLAAFGEALPALRKQLEADLALTGLPMQKVLAAVIMIMQHTSIRIGNNSYEKLYGSFGLTTLKDKHVAIDGSTVRFSFKGKKGVYHDVQLKSRKLSKLIKQCRDIPGKELFQYYDEQGQRHAIDSGMVNDYIKHATQGSFTAKDFRTWIGTVEAIGILKEAGCEETATAAKRKIATALDEVAKRLGNTRTVCKKYYVHPTVLEMFEDKRLEQYCSKQFALDNGLTENENILMDILQSTTAVTIKP